MNSSTPSLELVDVRTFLNYYARKQYENGQEKNEFLNSFEPKKFKRVSSVLCSQFRFQFIFRISYSFFYIPTVLFLCVA